SKTCSGCGWRNPSLTLSDLTFSCPSCGLVADRDHNAAINLKHQVAASTSETVNARGADRKTNAPAPPARRRVAVKREPGTAKTGQTRGAGAQVPAA
ncbi:zinc ribbon domain-containing protein, partial [Parafrankia sp. BMG5.11]|uniref:zinc ribbon domain-containing protein n=1 Tax=Parafrankia sp. BMG5.11 TaxID=222540 RepID=UPI0010DFE657